MLENLEVSLRNKKFSPLYLFYGGEDLLIEEGVDLIVSSALDESSKSFNLDIVNGDEIDAKTVVSHASSFPMMSEHRVVVVRDFDKMANKELLLPFINNPLSSTLLVIISQKPDFRQKFFKSFREHGTVIECKPLYDDKVTPWISMRIQKLGKRATHEACQLLFNYIGKSLREIQNEIDKLFIFVGEKKIIEADDVNAVVGMSKNYNIFELQRAIGLKNVPQSFEILERMLDAGERPTSMIIMLTKYFQKVWVLQELKKTSSNSYQLATTIGVNLRFFQEYLIACKNYASSQLENCFIALVRTDSILKSTTQDPKLVMTLLLHQIIKPQLY